MAGKNPFVNRFAIGLTIVGSVIIWSGVGDCNRSRTAKASPQVLTAEQLTLSGFGNNSNVEVTDYYLGENVCMIQTKSGRALTLREAWIPLVSKAAGNALIINSVEAQRVAAESRGEAFDEENAQPTLKPATFRCLVHLKSIHSEYDVTPIFGRDTLQGLVVGGDSAINSEQMGILRGKYPGVDLNRSFVLELDQQPAGIGRTVMTFGIGLALIALSVFMFVRAGPPS